jgi:hypothetical protein
LTNALNHFDYFSEIEERFSQRRGAVLLLSTLDWALIETWREAGVPLQAVLRGIDAAFDKYEARAAKARGRMSKVNGLAWCSQAVMEAAEEMVEAATGLAPVRGREEHESGFEAERVAKFLEGNAASLEKTAVGAATAVRLRELGAEVRTGAGGGLDELDRTLTVLEEKLLLVVQAAADEAELVALREQSERELAPYRAKMTATQLRQVRAQYEHKRLFQLRGLPRLSLFYMGHED